MYSVEIIPQIAIIRQTLSVYFSESVIISMTYFNISKDTQGVQKITGKLYLK
jgi:hypothetical protein